MPIPWKHETCHVEVENISGKTIQLPSSLGSAIIPDGLAVVLQLHNRIPRETLEQLEYMATRGVIKLAKIEPNGVSTLTLESSTKTPNLKDLTVEWFTKKWFTKSQTQCATTGLDKESKTELTTNGVVRIKRPVS